MRIESLIFSQLMTNESYARKVTPHLSEEYFQNQGDKVLFKLYSRFLQKHNSIPSKQALLIETEKLKASQDVYVSVKDTISETVDFSESMEFLIDKTETFCKERAIYNALRDAVLIADGQDKNKSADAIPAILQSALNVCFDSSVGHDYYLDYEHRYDYYHRKDAKVPTGSSTFDSITRGGWSRKTLNVLLAPPHGGKSFLMVNFARGAVEAGFNVLYITLEMAEEEIGKRFDQAMMRTTFDEMMLFSRETFNSQFSKVQAKSHGKMIIREYPTGQGHAGHFRSLLSELKQKQNFNPDLIVVDYMGICASEVYKSGSSANTYTIVGSIGKELRALAIESDSAIVTAVQTNRSGVANTDIDITATSDSFGIPAIADWFGAIITSDELKEMNQMMIRQLKNRYKSLDEPNKFMIGTDFSRMIIHDLEDSGVKRTVSNNRDSGGSVPFPDHKINSVNSFDDFDFN
jgi:KaiC/GvpD/RAD55 family RecA-like ATPase